MAGMPFSGKSFVVNKICNELSKNMVVEVIDPKCLRSDDYSDCNEEKRRDINLAAWEVSLDLLMEEIEESPNKDVIIYDTACASLPAMEGHFITARKCKHQIFYVHIKAPLAVCRHRAGDAWLHEDVVSRYISKFKESVPRFTELSDVSFIIDNSSNDNSLFEPDVSKIIEAITSVK